MHKQHLRLFFSSRLMVNWWLLGSQVKKALLTLDEYNLRNEENLLSK
jgi:hypothetical protein